MQINTHVFYKKNTLTPLPNFFTPKNILTIFLKKN